MIHKTEDELIKQHTGLIIVQASKFNDTSLSDSEDYIAAGRIGLLKAIRYYDESRDTKFSTFATTCIRREMIRESSYDKDVGMQKTVDEQVFVYEHNAEWWEMLPDNLSDLEVNVLEDRVLKNFTLQEIGDRWGHTKQWASNVLYRAINKVRDKYG